MFLLFAIAAFESVHLHAVADRRSSPKLWLSSRTLCSSVRCSQSLIVTATDSYHSANCYTPFFSLHRVSLTIRPYRCNSAGCGLLLRM